MQSINPYTGEIIFTIKPFSSEEIEKAINESSSSYANWKQTPLLERTQFFVRLADILQKNKEEWGKIMTLEIGKPISQSIAEIEKCAWVCKYYSENAEEQLAPKEIKTDAQSSYVSYEPLGAILGVMPWNYPFWQVFRFAVPTLIAGNTVLIKHASNVMKSAQCIAEAFEKAKFPKNVFCNLPIGSEQVENILRNPKIKGVSLTGSKPAGASVASIAASEIKPSLLELGGNNALIVFEDCNLKETVKQCINARFQNTGQSCIAGKRLLVSESIAEEFISLLKEEIEHLKSGNPLEPETFIGTMVHEKAAKELYEQLESSLKDGAILVTGGNYKGAYFAPTLVKNVSDQMRIFKEETFGPLLACATFKSEEEAITLANNSEFGLGVSIFTKDKKRIERMIPRLEEGAVFVNDMVKSDPRLPFGGIKISGYGRELSKEGILAFTNKKTVYIK